MSLFFLSVNIQFFIIKYHRLSKNNNQNKEKIVYLPRLISNLLNIMKKGLWITVIIFLLILTGLGFYKFYFVFGEGVKAGELNYMVRKGVIFKTYEGKLIQSGFRSAGKVRGTAIQSYEFEFSVEDEEIAKKLMYSSGKDMELHYKEYKGALPWRGFSRYVVDGIISIDGKKTPDSNLLNP